MRRISLDLGHNPEENSSGSDGFRARGGKLLEIYDLSEEVLTDFFDGTERYR
jgi:hypothetical protein